MLKLKFIERRGKLVCKL